MIDPVTASMAVLDFAAKYKTDVLYNRYQAGRDAIRRYTEEPPYAYFIPREQRDPVAPVELLRRLAFNGIRISQLEESVTHQGITYPAGSWVIPMDQEFAELARTLLEVQHYPDLREYPGGPPARPDRRFPPPPEEHQEDAPGLSPKGPAPGPRACARAPGAGFPRGEVPQLQGAPRPGRHRLHRLRA